MAISHDTSLKDILQNIGDGTTQLPEFQRDWVWDDERIRALIASVTCSYSVGAVMFLECGGSEIHFKSRMFTNVPDNGKTPELLVLDGQQRLTSIYCAMYSRTPVPTQTAKKEKIKRYYYLDIENASQGLKSQDFPVEWLLLTIIQFRSTVCMCVLPRLALQY